MTTGEPRSDDTAADGRPLPADAKGGRVETLRIELGADYPRPNDRAEGNDPPPAE